MSDAALIRLLALLDLESAGADAFAGTSPPEPVQRIFGGQVLAQGLVAAARTVDLRRSCHSFHAYFLRPGDPRLPIRYQVDRCRDGGELQRPPCGRNPEEAQIFILAASFQKGESGFEHQSRMPVVPPPESLEDDQQVLLRDENADRRGPRLGGARAAL